jgi:hypothetical protein
MVLSNRPVEQLEIDEKDRKDMMDTLPDQRYIYPNLLKHRSPSRPPSSTLSTSSEAQNTKDSKIVR